MPALLAGAASLDHFRRNVRNKEISVHTSTDILISYGARFKVQVQTLMMADCSGEGKYLDLEIARKQQRTFSEE